MAPEQQRLVAEVLAIRIARDGFAWQHTCHTPGCPDPVIVISMLPYRQACPSCGQHMDAELLGDRMRAEIYCQIQEAKWHAVQ